MIDPGLAWHPSFIKMPTLTLPGGAVGLVYVYTVYRVLVHKLFVGGGGGGVRAGVK